MRRNYAAADMLNHAWLMVGHTTGLVIGCLWSWQPWQCMDAECARTSLMPKRLHTEHQPHACLVCLPFTALLQQGMGHACLPPSMSSIRGCGICIDQPGVDRLHPWGTIPVLLTDSSMNCSCVSRRWWPTCGTRRQTRRRMWILLTLSKRPRSASVSS